MNKLGKDKIEKGIPHRFENLLIDEVTMLSENDGNFEVTISADDSAGRQLFYRKPELDHPTILSPVLMEILALASISAAGGVREDQLLLYAGIRNFQISRLPELGEKLTGYVKKKMQKGPLVQFKGEFRLNDIAYATGTMTAYVGSKTALLQSEGSETFIKPNPPLIESELNYQLPEGPTDKSDLMRCCDRLINVNREENLITGQYTYPDTHPCIKGHFPDTPVMMGVMQMIAVEDLAFLFVNYENVRSLTQVKCDAVILSLDGSIISELKQVELNPIKENGKYLGLSTKSVQKVTFKKRISPLDTVYIQLINPIIS